MKDTHEYKEGFAAGLREALQMTDRTRAEQKERPNAGMVLGWLRVSLCERIANGPLQPSDTR